MMNKKIRTVVLSMMILFFTVIPLSMSIHAGSDLPIVEDEISQVEGVTTRAVTVSRGIDLFTDRSREVTQAMVTQREARREEALMGLFDPYLQLKELSGEERLMSHVTNSGLFREGASFREGGPIEASQEEPILMIVTLLIFSGVVGFIIAKFSMQRKERKENVH